MRKLGDQWIEIIDGQEHMVKCVGIRTPVIADGNNYITKDLGILKDGLLPCPFCDKYPSLIKPEYGYQRLERQSRNGYAYECGCGVICGWDYDYGGTHQTEQEAKDAWNRRA